MTYLEPGQPFVSKGRDGVGEQSNGQEDQEGLIWLEILGDADSVGVLEDIETSNEQQRSSKVDSEGYGDVARNI